MSVPENLDETNSFLDLDNGGKRTLLPAIARGYLGEFKKPISHHKKSGLLGNYKDLLAWEKEQKALKKAQRGPRKPLKQVLLEALKRLF